MQPAKPLWNSLLSSKGANFHHQPPKISHWLFAKGLETTQSNFKKMKEKALWNTCL